MHSGASGDRLQCASRVLQRALHGGPLAVCTWPDRVARRNSPRAERAALSANAVPPRGQLEVVDESDMHERLLQTVTPGNAPPPIQEELLQGWKAVRVHMRAWANLYGAQFVWLGVWSAMTVDVERNWGWVPGVKRDLLYVGFGLACSLLFDQFYADAGVAGSMWLDLRNDKWFGCVGCCGATRQAPPGLVSKLAFVIATPLTLFSNIVLWIGLCSLLDDWVFAELVARGGGLLPGHALCVRGERSTRAADHVAHGHTLHR